MTRHFVMMAESKTPTPSTALPTSNTVAYIRLAQALLVGVFILGLALSGGDYSAAVKLPISSSSLTLMVFGGIGALYSEVVARRAERKAASSGPSGKSVFLGNIAALCAILSVSMVLIIGYTMLGTFMNVTPYGSSGFVSEQNATIVNSLYLASTASGLPLVGLLVLVVAACLVIGMFLMRIGVSQFGGS